MDLVQSADFWIGLLKIIWISIILSGAAIVLGSGQMLRWPTARQMQESAR